MLFYANGVKNELLINWIMMSTKKRFFSPSLT